MSIIVIGSISTILLSQVKSLPAAGGTVSGDTFSHFPGGKGANQAVASTRLGVDTHLVSCVGNDNFGPHLTKLLLKQNVYIGGISRDDKYPTGVAQRFVAEDGQTMTVISGGANQRIGRQALSTLDRLAPDASVLVLSLDIPMETVLMAARFGSQYGLTIILDPNPTLPVPDELWDLIDIITPDAQSASAMVGFKIGTDDDAQAAAETLYGRGPRQVVLNRWGKGTHIVSATESRKLMPYPIMPLDTSIGSDAMTGALAAGLATGRSFAESVYWGVTASSIAMTRPHGLNTLPTLEEVNTLLATYQPHPL